MSASQRPRQRAPTPPYMFSKNAGGDNPDQPASKQHKTRQRSPTPPGRPGLRHCNPPMSTRQRPPTPPSKEEAALPKENQQISHEGRPRQRSPSPPSSRMDSFSIGNPSDRDSMSTISSSFKRKLSWVYNRLRSSRRPSGSIRTRINGNEEAPSDDNIPHRTPSPPATIGAPTIPQRTRSPPARRASSLNIENQSIRSDGSAKGRKLKRCLAILLALIASFVVISGVIVVIYYFKNKENNQTDTVADGDQVFSGLLRVNETFTYEMADSRSPKFLSFEERFCSNIESVVTRNVSLGGCKVNSLSNGSIIVNFTLVITHPMSVVNGTRDLLLCLFNGTQVGTMRVDSRATQFIFNPHGNETIFGKELKSSSCSSDSLPISPTNYTYPDYCGDYQVCIQGNSVLQTCPQGQEFAYLLPGDTVICAPPSHNTYCGQKRSETEKTTSRLPSSTSVTDSKQEVKLSTDTSQNALAYSTSSSCPSTTTTTTTTTTSMDCSNVFTCSSSYTFIPANDTYPDNCGKYQECIAGKSKVRYCAEGSHFVYSQQNINACHGTDDPLTYCNMMTFFKSVCSENSKHFVTTGSQDEA